MPTPTVPNFMDFHVSVPQLYGLVAIFTAATWQIFRTLRWTLRLLLPFVFFRIERLTAALRRIFSWTALSEFDVVFVPIYITANAVCLSLHVKNQTALAARSGILATINLVPLLLGTQLGDVADFLGITLPISKIIHRWIGWVTLVEGGLHTAISAQAANLKWTSLETWGIIVTLTITALVTVLCARRYFYEAFLGLHIITTAVAAIALWRHLSVGQFQARYYILGGIVFWGGGLLVGFLADCRYNVNLGQGKWLPMATVATVYQTEKDDQVVMTDACHLEIIARRRWSVQPGEYLFICLCGLRFPYNFQRHPFWIVWWDEDSGKGVVQLDMLVRERKGFTRRLLSHQGKEYTAWISRPFGRSEGFGNYGSVLMFATDVGIVAHLPYLKTLMQGRSEASIRTRHVVVVWQVEDSNHDKWVKKWFDKLLPNDRFFMLEIRIHCPSDGRYLPASGGAPPVDLCPGKVLTAGEHDLVKLIASPAHVEAILDEEMSRNGRGRLLVSVCADSKTRATLRRSIAEQVDAGVRYHEHEFQIPDKRRRLFST